MEDIEKRTNVDEGYDTYSEENGAVKEFHIFNKFEQFAADQLKAEIRGIEKVPEYEKTDTSYWNAASMWMGGNMVINTFALGVLGISTFGLTFWDSVLVIIFFNILGALPVAFYSTFGAEFGLRQMVLSRFWFGYEGVRILAFLNCVACIGWTAVNTMVSAQFLHVVNNGGLPPWGGILVLTILTMIVTFFGYKIVHHFEKWSWVPTFIIFIIIAVEIHKTGAFTTGTLFSGPVEAGDCLSFGATIFGFATGWSTYASDYTTYMHPRSSKPIVFFSVLIGLCFPLCFGMILGTAAMATTLSGDPTTNRFLIGYDNNSVGGLVYEILVDQSLNGFGQFCMVLLAISTVANNVPNMYSLGLSAQTVWTGFRKIPRVIWTILGCGISVAIAIPAYLHFSTAMQNFMDLIGYWLAIYSGVALTDHFVYKRGKFSSYDADLYDNKKELAIGISAIFAFCAGVAGAALGMSQVWYVGVLARKIGDPTFGGDIGFELAFGFSAIVYLSTRWIEMKYIR